LGSSFVVACSLAGTFLPTDCNPLITDCVPTWIDTSLSARTQTCGMFDVLDTRLASIT
jgi:hypothetical protein